MVDQIWQWGQTLPPAATRERDSGRLAYGQAGRVNRPPGLIWNWRNAPWFLSRGASQGIQYLGALFQAPIFYFGSTSQVQSGLRYETSPLYGGPSIWRSDDYSRYGYFGKGGGFALTRPKTRDPLAGEISVEQFLDEAVPMFGPERLSTTTPMPRVIMDAFGIDYGAVLAAWKIAAIPRLVINNPSARINRDVRDIVTYLPSTIWHTPTWHAVEWIGQKRATTPALPLYVPPVRLAAATPRYIPVPGVAPRRSQFATQLEFTRAYSSYQAQVIQAQQEEARARGIGKDYVDPALDRLYAQSDAARAAATLALSQDSIQGARKALDAVPWTSLDADARKTANIAWDRRAAGMAAEMDVIENRRNFWRSRRTKENRAKPKKKKDKKPQGVLGTALKVYNAGSEALDFAEAIAQAMIVQDTRGAKTTGDKWLKELAQLTWEKKSFGRALEQMGGWAAVIEFDVERALYNLIINEIEDRIYGLGSVGSGQAGEINQMLGILDYYTEDVHSQSRNPHSEANAALAREFKKASELVWKVAENLRD